jgi:hypothetical protein
MQLFFQATLKRLYLYGFSIGENNSSFDCNAFKRYLDETKIEHPSCFNSKINYLIALLWIKIKKRSPYEEKRFLVWNQSCLIK